MINKELILKELRFKASRSSGSGGQNVNKVETAVRLRHQPSGIVVECQETRSQGQNRDKAIQMLKSQLFEIEMRKKKEAQAEIEGDHVVVWSDKVTQPVAVRYAWANHPANCNLYNKTGEQVNLPASPFQSHLQQNYQ